MVSDYIFIPAASIAVFRENMVLLVLRPATDAVNLWSLPGGHIRNSETPEAAARRELREETGVEADNVIQIDEIKFSITTGTAYNIHVFAGIWRSGEARPADDALSARWVAIDGIPDLDTTGNLNEIILKAASNLSFDTSYRQ